MSKRIILAFIFLFVFAKDAYSKILPTFVQKVDRYIDLGATNGIALNPDGTKIFIGQFNNDNTFIFEYELDTAFDISSKNAGTEETLDLNAGADDINKQFEDFTFNNDGTKIFAIDDDGGMNIHTLSTAYDLTSATQVTDDGINWSTYLVPFLDKIATGVMHPNTIRFNNDGRKMYLSHAVINSNDTVVAVVQYNLGTAFDPSSAGSVEFLNVREDFPKINKAIHALNFDDDGTRMYLSAGHFGSTSDHPLITYELSEPFNIRSAKKVGSYNHFGAAGGATVAVGGVFSSTGLKYYMTTGTGNFGAVIEYTLGCPFGLVICESDAETATVTSAQVEIAKNVITQNASTIFKRFDWLRRNENNTNLNSHNIKLNIDISNPVLTSLKNNFQNSLNKNLENSLNNVDYIQASLNDKNPFKNVRNWSHWSHGDISFGRFGDTLSLKPMDVSTKGIMFGLDRLIDNKIFGYAFRYGNDEIDIKSSANNKLKSQSYTLNVYSSIQIPDKINLNALLGASFLSMDQLTSGSVTGERNGKQIFTAITYEHENPYSKFELIPFGKFDLGVNQFSEYSDFNSSTAGAERHIDLIFLTSNISGGFKFDNTLYLNDSSLNRNGFVEYIHDLTPDIEHKFVNLADNTERTKTLEKHSRSYLKGNIGFEYANSDGYTFAINYERLQSILKYESSHLSSLLIKVGKKQMNKANFDVIYDPTNNNKTEVSYLKNFGNFNLKLNSNYSLFSKIPDYGANIEISGTF